MVCMVLLGLLMCGCVRFVCVHVVVLVWFVTCVLSFFWGGLGGCFVSFDVYVMCVFAGVCDVFVLVCVCFVVWLFFCAYFTVLLIGVV